jgi:hypothetical protein
MTATTTTNPPATLLTDEMLRHFDERAPRSTSASTRRLQAQRLEQLLRDARLGRIHPVNSLLTHELVGKFSLGIDPDEQPRWG